MNLVDSVIAAFSPARAVRRAQARRVLAAYEGGKSTKRNKKSRDNSTGERQVVRDAATVRATMRDLERNHDLVRGGLLTLTRNVIGPNGISIEPTPRKGVRGAEDYDDIDDDFARDLLNAFREWSVRPEVTRTMSWVQAQEMAFRARGRDGECFVQLVEGLSPTIRHASAVPLSIELLEADVVPLDYDRETPNIQAGIERNAWGEPVAYWVHKNHPGNGGWFVDNNLKRVPAQRMLHLANRERFSGLRGISQFASAIDRLLDVKGYEGDEMMAARISARTTLSIKRDVAMEGWTPPLDASGQPQNPADREFLIEPGAVFDQLYPGESLEMANPNRPNPNLGKFRADMLRAASRAASLTYSAISGDYDGTYSAQRQELVEGYDGYRMLTEQFVSEFVRPVWERFVTLGIASGVIKVPAHIRPETVMQADFRGPKMPWIDPQREAAGLQMLARGGWQSVTQGIADRGMRMQDVYEQLARERKLAEELGLILDSDARYTSKSGVAQSVDPAADPAAPADPNNPDAAGSRSRESRAREPRTRLNGHDTGATH